jgi:hypothetical protein
MRISRWKTLGLTLWFTLVACPGANGSYWPIQLGPAPAQTAASQTSSRGSQTPAAVVKAGPVCYPLGNTQPSLELPPQAGSWVLEITKASGLTGTVVQEIVLTSQGSLLTANGLIQGRSEAAQQIGSIVSDTDPGSWQASDQEGGSASLCSDCNKMSLTLYLRKHDGTTAGYRACWDEITSGKLHRDVDRLYGAANLILEASRR